MPKMIPAGKDALAIYEEIIAALPHHDTAAQALFGKGMILQKDNEYTSAIEVFQNLIRRFPKHPLAVSSYVEVCRTYLLQAQGEYPNPDFLDLAEINLGKFQDNFPGDVKIVQAKEIFQEMQELYAENLYETGKFYERTKKPGAAQLYFTKLSNRYPTTKAALQAKERLLKYEKPAPAVDPQEEAAPDAAGA